MAIQDRKEREKQLRRDSIIRSAEACFSEKGFEGTTMQEISDGAELSKATLYIYFKSKEELYLTVCTQGLEQFGERLQEAVGHQSRVEDQVKAVYRAYIEQSLRDPMMFRVLQDTFIERVRRNISENIIREINGIIRGWLEYGSKLASEGVETGVFKKGLDTYGMSVAAWRMATGLIELALLSEPQVADLEGMGELFDLSIELLVEGARAGD
jgi:TetR/AcrR family transcriptional regulator